MGAPTHPTRPDRRARRLRATPGRRHGLTALNVPNKTRDDDPLRTLAALRQLHAAGAPPLDVALHYSTKHNLARGEPGASLDKLLAFCRGVAQQQQQEQAAAAGGVRVRVLLVSGSGERRFDSLAALRALAERGETSELPELGVAFNPYLAGDAGEREASRLAAKLATGLVSSVWLQMGVDDDALRRGLGLLQRLQAQRARDGQPALEVFGSVFLPTKRLLAQMRFRPWAGVTLSEDYLGSVEGAARVTARLLATYAAAGVVPLLESRVASDDELRGALELLAPALGGAARPE